MNRLDIKLGGHPLTADDLLFLQTQLSDTIRAIAETTGKSFIAISGVEIVIGVGSISWTSGLVYMGGELCIVDAGVAAYPANTTFQIVETYDPEGNVQYEDLNTEDTWIYRKAVISGAAGGAYDFSNLLYLKDWLMLENAGFSSLGTILAGGSSWGFIDGAFTAGFRTHQSREVHMNGRVNTANYQAANDTVICTLPVPPGKDLFFLCSGTIGGVRSSIHVKVTQAGDVMPLGLANGAVVEIYLESIRYPVDWSGII